MQIKEIIMCFSAGASYAAAALLSVGGVFILSQVKEARQRLFAAIPCIFALQQFFEGILWTSYGYNLSPAFHAIGTYGFLFFAIPFWPLWIPLSTYIMETNKSVKRILFYLFLLGCVIFVLSLLSLIFYGASSDILACHIQYKVNVPYISMELALLIYAFATIIPLFISTTRYMKLFAVAILISLFSAQYFYSEFFISTWCFFSAGLSILIFMILHQKKNRQR